MAQQLITATDRQYHQISGNRCPQPWSLALDQIAGYQCLTTILTTAEKRQVHCLPVNGVAGIDRYDLKHNMTALTPLTEGNDVSAITVHVHVIWIEMGQSQGQLHIHARTR
jgi:hypothetical protein